MCKISLIICVGTKILPKTENLKAFYINLVMMCGSPNLRVVWPSWFSDCSRRRRYRVQIFEKYKKNSKLFWIFLGHIITSLIQHDGLIWRDLCQVFWLWITLAGEARTKALLLVDSGIKILRWFQICGQISCIFKTVNFRKILNRFSLIMQGFVHKNIKFVLNCLKKKLRRQWKKN